MSITIIVRIRQGGPPLQLYRHKNDIEMWGGPRGNAPCPAVFPICGTQFTLTREWQHYIAAINYHMALNHVAALFGNSKAFCNGSGYRDPDAPNDDPRANWILEEDLQYPPPQFSRMWTCANACHTGHEVVNPVGNRVLISDCLDGTQPPPIKPGRPRPRSAIEAQAHHDDYLIVPRTHRRFFYIANNQQLTGRVTPAGFNGAVYDWMESDLPFCFMPFVSDDVVSSLLARDWIKLPPGSPYASPYT